MDNLTHSLFGLTLARTPLSRAGRGTTAALLLASNAPDADVIVTLGGTARYLELHRGPTHGPIGVAVLSLAVAGLVVLGQRWRGGANDSNPPAAFLALWGLSNAIGIVGHVLMDLPTSYGTRLLSPFAWTWFSVDWMPIVDIYLLAILGGALWFGGSRLTGPERTRRRRRHATIALALMGMNYGVRAASHHAAVAGAPAIFGNRLPEWCSHSVRPVWSIDRWPRPAPSAPRDASAMRCVVEVAAIPDFISPFRWRLVAQLSNGYEIRDVDLLGRSQVTGGSEVGLPKRSIHIPNQWTPVVARAAAAPTARVFLGFSRFPAASSIIGADGTATVRWSDIRFAQDPLDDSRQFRRGLFTAVVVMAPDGRVVSDRLGP